jgi:hypothetical protein
MPPTENWEHRIRSSYRRQLITAKAIIDGYARLGETLTYDTLGRMIGLSPDRPAVRASLLDLISSDANSEGRGLVTVIVTGEDGMPGPGWFTLADSLGRDVGDHDALVRNERDYVFAHANDDAESSIF